MEKTNETKGVENKVAATSKRRVHDAPYTFYKDCMVTNYVKNEIVDRNDPSLPPSYWYAVSVADGRGFDLKDVSASKDCSPWELQTLKMYRVYFTLSQQPNKNGSGLRNVVKIVDFEEI